LAPGVRKEEEKGKCTVFSRSRKLGRDGSSPEPEKVSNGRRHVNQQGGGKEAEKPTNTEKRKREARPVGSTSLKAQELGIRCRQLR